MKEASYYSQEKDGLVKCHLCPRKCIIKEGKTGFCHVRQNMNGKLFSLVYGRAAGGLVVDPIEKKPLFHFLPGTMILSFGTVGCNLHCKHCQNWTTSQAKPGQHFEKSFLPEDIVRIALEKGCKSIAYTYNEPTIFFEYMLDTAKLARENGLKNVMVSNGFINPKPLEELSEYLDAANIDLKAFDDLFYKHETDSWLQPVLKTLISLKKAGVWVEITNLLIPGLNEDLGEIEEMCKWIIENLGADTPLHFSAFHPDYELMNIPNTSIISLVNAHGSAKKIGLKYVYIGNVMTREFENTICPKCNNILINRFGFRVSDNNIIKGECSFCKEKIMGVFQ